MSKPLADTGWLQRVNNAHVGYGPDYGQWADGRALPCLCRWDLDGFFDLKDSPDAIRLRLYPRKVKRARPVWLVVNLEEWRWGAIERDCENPLYECMSRWLATCLDQSPVPKRYWVTIETRGGEK